MRVMMMKQEHLDARKGDPLYTLFKTSPSWCNNHSIVRSEGQTGQLRWKTTNGCLEAYHEFSSPDEKINSTNGRQSEIDSFIAIWA